MNKYACMALALAPVVCMSSYASDEVAAQDALKGAISELTTLVSTSKDKELVTLVDELDALLAKVTPDILAKLEPLTDEQRMMIIGSLAQAPELAALMEASQPLGESKAAATLAPIVSGENPAAAAELLPYASKIKLIDIVANLTKIAIGLGADKMGLQMATACDDCESEDECESDVEM